MPNVSGSPTQIATSAATAAILAGTPDDAFRDGDQAWVESLQRYFILRRDTAPFAANNSTLIATFSGNGYWMLDGLPGEFWGGVGNWYIDAVNGSNLNSGTSQNDPIQSLSEFSRRIQGAVNTIYTNVWLLSDTSENDVLRLADLPNGSRVHFEGSLGTTSAVGGTITAVAGYAAGSMAVNQHYEIDVDVPAAGLVGKMLKIGTGEVCWGVLAVGANKLRTTPFINTTTGGVTTPGINTPFTIETPPTIAAPPFTRGEDNEASILFREIAFTNTIANIPTGVGFTMLTAFTACKFSDGYWELISGYAALTGCLLYGEPGKVVEFDVWDYAELEVYESAFVSDFGIIYMYPNSRLYLSDRTLMESGAHVVARDGSQVRVSNLAVYNASIGTIYLESFCTLAIESSSGDAYVYGTGNAQEIISLGANNHATYAVLAHLVSTGAANPVIFRGYADQTWAALPTVKTAAAADTQSTFVLAV